MTGNELDALPDPVLAPGLLPFFFFLGLLASASSSNSVVFLYSANRLRTAAALVKWAVRM